MPFFTEKEKKAIRENSFIMHCPEVCLKQENVDDGICFSGYGIIHLHKSGFFYIDFICLKSSKSIDFTTTIPENPLEKSQEVILYATTLSQREIVCHNVKLKPNLYNFMNPNITQYQIVLNELVFNDKDKFTVDYDIGIQIEFKEDIEIPANFSTKTESSLGYKSMSWNQTHIDYNKNKISIIRHSDYTEVNVLGDDFDVDNYISYILFYINLTSGRLVQPYYLFVRKKNDYYEKIFSINNKRINAYIPPPLCSYMSDGKDILNNQHYSLLKKIIEIGSHNSERFNCILSYWKSIWNAFRVNDFSVQSLTLSVAIEGVINDIFIPVFIKKYTDTEFENLKQNIIEEINGLENIDPKHRKSLSDYVNNWGRIHIKKALGILVDNEIIGKLQKDTWSALRNKSTHPKLIGSRIALQKKDIDRIVICLGMFYRLVLNIFKYSGPQFCYSQSKDKTIKEFPYNNVIGD